MTWVYQVVEEGVAQLSQLKWHSNYYAQAPAVLRREARGCGSGAGGDNRGTGRIAGDEDGDGGVPPVPWRASKEAGDGDPS